MSKRLALLTLLLLISLLCTLGVQAWPQQTLATRLSPGAAVAQSDSSVMFIENGGQFAEGARFQVWGGKHTTWLAEDGIWITLLEVPLPQPLTPEQVGKTGADSLSQPQEWRETEAQAQRGVNLKLSFPGSNPHPRLEPLQRLQTVVSYFIGSDPEKWHPAVPVWGGVRYVDLYPGIDLEVGQEGGAQAAPLPWRLVARDGADWSRVRLRLEGADGLALEGDRVRVSTAVGELSLPLLPAVAADGSALPRWQEGPRVSANEITAPFASPAAIPTASLHLAAAANQPSGGSVADNPADLLYSTFLGGSGSDESNAIAVDGAGCAYVTGLTYSSDFPSTTGAFDHSYGGGQYDAFVVKVNADGTGLAYATFLGGSGRDWGKAIALDGIGCAYVTGGTDSSNFPTTTGAFDRSYNGGDYDAFVLKVNANGTGLAYATFLGGMWGDEGRAITVDGTDCADVTGVTRSSDFPSTVGAFDRSYSGVASDDFVVKVDANGTDLLYATFLGGSGHDLSNAIAVDGAGCAYVTGLTNSSDFPSTAGAFDRSYNGGQYDAFVVKVNADGARLPYAAFLGGSEGDEGRAIAVDGLGCAYVTGDTDSSNFPTTSGAFDRSYNGGRYEGDDVFVVKVNANGMGLAYATFLGGSAYDFGMSLAVDGVGCAYLTGWAYSPNFPTTAGAFDRSHNAGDAYVAKLAMGAAPAPTPTATHTPTRSPTPTATPTVAITIAHIEVTQVIQNEDSNVTLIAGKPTFARVYVQPSQGCATFVTGVLRGYVDGRELPGSPLSSVDPFISPCKLAGGWTGQRENLGASLNFTLPLQWCQGSLTLTAEVGARTLSANVTFHPTRVLRVIYVPLRYGGREPDRLRIANAYRWAVQIYPVADLYYEPTPTLDLGNLLCLEPSCTPFLREYSSIALRTTLNALYLRYFATESPNGPDYIFGWLPDGVVHGGNGVPFGAAAYADDLPSGGPQLFAHELAHLLGREHTQAPADPHPDCADPGSLNSDWPNRNSAAIQEWGVDGWGFAWLMSSPNALLFPDSYDYMSYCWLRYGLPAWTSVHTYQKLYERLRVPATTLATDLPTPTRYCLVSGLVNADDSATLHPIWVITATAEAGTLPPGTQYCLEAQDASGRALAQRCFGLSFISHDTGQPMGMDGFNAMLPYPDRVARIVLKKGTRELAARSVSPAAPQVTVLRPNGGEVWEDHGDYTVAWTASDGDGDALTYQVSYSPDGTRWIPLGAPLQATQLVVSAAELPGGAHARVRVEASDGINTGADESNASFAVASKDPQVSILSPDGAGAARTGASVLLQGHAYDLEDGALEGTSLRWESSRDGLLGTGSQLLVHLSYGQHRITLSARDADGNSAAASISVQVGYKLCLPLIMRP